MALCCCIDAHRLGDSGGPNFIGETTVIGGITSFSKNKNCGGTSGVYRLDTADDLEWLATFGIYPHTEE
jgi:hypothetical protein